MFAFRRGRLPLLGPLAAAVAFGYLLAGGLGSAVGALLFLPFLVMKVVFMMLFLGFVFKLFAHRSGFAAGRSSDPPKAATTADRDWEEAVRAAKREIDKLFPNPGDNSGDQEQ